MAAEKYNIIQVGIVLFVPSLDSKVENRKLTSNENMFNDGDGALMVCAHIPNHKSGTYYDAHVFNIFVFPNNKSSVRPKTLCQRTVTLDPVTVEFLTHHNMDFNKWIKGGVPYMHQLQVKDYEVMFNIQWKKRMENYKLGLSKKRDDAHRVHLDRAEDRHFIQSTMTAVSEWFANPEAEQVFVLPSCNSFLRRALYEEIEKTICQSKVVVSKFDDERGDKIEVRKWEPLVHQKMMDQARDKIELEEVGAYRIIEALSRECKSRCVPLVVHNGMTDILFLMSHFYSTPLPDNFEGFKALLIRTFPYIYDTKYIANQYVNTIESSAKPKSTKLFDLFHFFRTYENSEVVDGLLCDAQLHSAGYDAFITGIVYENLKLVYKDYENEINKVNIWRGREAPTDLPSHFDFNKSQCGRKRKSSIKNHSS